MAGISNVAIENFIEEENDDFQRNFVGVYSSNRTTPFLNFLKMMKRKGGCYPLVVLNTARHYISLMDVAQNLIFITAYYVYFKLLMILFSFQ